MTTTEVAKVAVLNKQTLMPLGVVAALCLSLLGAGWTAANAMNSLRHEVEQNKTAIESFGKKLDGMNGNRWTIHNMELWVTRLQAENAALKIPPVRKH